eukprot:CAMPEP_0194406026 /NCGR_PEP_ID=MMETSP0176-20130528/4335_1 /TAXON_ID=216777 /ORGANISM="Proboscia alata, Strain PI-D3" /LENGTH=35 /DNA_ID= /DNA_START= /DNA_END= /DNA_ORIENTATION=
MAIIQELKGILYAERNPFTQQAAIFNRFFGITSIT